MMNRFVLGFFVVASVACGGDETNGNDASTDSSLPDVGKDVGTTDAGNDVTVADASSDASSDASDAGAFTPKSLTGLVLWLDANVGVTQSNNAVSAWADQSGNNNNATQGTANFQPTLAATGLKGKPSIHFAGGTHISVADAATIRWSTGDFYVAVVMSETTTTGTYGMVFSKQDVPYPFAGPGIFANFALPAASTSWGGQVDFNHYVSTGTTGLNDGTAHYFSFDRTGSTLTVRLDGAVGGTNVLDAGAIDVSGTGAPISIGANQAGGQSLTGDIAEIIAINGTASSTDITNVESYLKAKYGF